MIHIHKLLACVALLSSPMVIAQPVPAQIVVVGTYHFSNPAKDIGNMQADDVFKPQRQLELEAISRQLQVFKPDKVAVEWPADITSERYARFREGNLPESRNEVVQLGYRLASALNLEDVYGLDVEGDFPWEEVKEWAEKHDQAYRTKALEEEIQTTSAVMTERQASSSIAEVLLYMNEPEMIAGGHQFYSRMLDFGANDEQPGVALLSSWYTRNFEICARMVQLLQPGEKMVVFYGAGHAYLLRQCITEYPGADLVELSTLLFR